MRNGNLDGIEEKGIETRKPSLGNRHFLKRTHLKSHWSEKYKIGVLENFWQVVLIMALSLIVVRRD
jgi:hypothetical protein